VNAAILTSASLACAKHLPHDRLMIFRKIPECIGKPAAAMQGSNAMS